MARQVIDVRPVITLTIGTPGRAYERRTMTREQAEQARDEALESINVVLKRYLRRNFDVEHALVEDAVCEHCSYPWTEARPDYNGGCCGLDEANSPERLKELRTLAEEVSDGTFYHFDEGRAGRVAINWPDQFGCAVVVWLDAGRPEVDVARLLSLAKRVKESDWCTIWQDPGPAGCSLPRQPDRVSEDRRPGDLADDLCSLLDDMGLLPATKAA